MRIREQFQTLLSALQGGVERPADINPVLAGAATKPLPTPQFTWLLLGLVAYAERLRWAWEVVHRRLPDAVHWAMETQGEFHGTVPGLPDWEYDCGGGCVTLTHKGTGEWLNLMVDRNHRLMSHDEFVGYYWEHREPGVAEQRLCEFFPRGNGLSATLNTLVRSGMVRDLPAEFELTSGVNRLVPDITNFLERWQDPAERFWLAVAVGDWPAAHETAVARGQTEVADKLAPLAEQCRQRWRNWLCRQVARQGIHRVGIQTLARAGVENLHRYIALALFHDWEAHSAIDVIAEDPSWCPTVFRLLMGERERGKRGWACRTRDHTTYLNRHHFRMARVMDLLLTDRESPLDLLIPLALEHRQDRLLPLLRRGLRSASNSDRKTAAAILALFDTDWARRELVAWLEEGDDWEATVECRLALRESSDAALWELADRWEAERPEAAAAYNPLVQTRPEHFRDRLIQLFELVHRHRFLMPS
jgi:hypothetical protein